MGHIADHILYMSTDHNKEVQKENKLFNHILFILTLIAIVNKLFSLVIRMQIEMGFRITTIQKDYACLSGKVSSKFHKYGGDEVEFK